MVAIPKRKPKPTIDGLRVSQIQAETLNAIHTHAAAMDLLLVAAEGIVQAREDLRDLANEKRVIAAAAESDAASIENVAVQLGTGLDDVSGTFSALTHL